MKVIKTNRIVYLECVADTGVGSQFTLKQNEQYVVSDGILDKIKELYGSKAVIVEIDLNVSDANRYNGQNLTDKKLLSIREGGAGDLLFKTPVFRYLKNKYPSCKIGLSCSPNYHSLFTQHPLVDIVYPHIFLYEDFKKYDYFATFEGLIEVSPEAHKRNAYELYSERFGIPFDLITNKIPVVSIPETTKDYWRFNLKEELDSPKKIVYQIRASSQIRSVPPELTAKIIKGLTALGYRVFLLDAQNKKTDVARLIQAFNLDVVDCSKFSDNFERMAGLISLMDLYVGPDSSGSHIAAALEIPIVGLFGPFRSELRLKYYKNTIGIDVIAKKCGMGCHAHGYSLCDFARDLDDTFAPCWKLLNEAVVIDAVNELWGKVHENVG